MRSVSGFETVGFGGVLVAEDVCFVPAVGVVLASPLVLNLFTTTCASSKSPDDERRGVKSGGEESKVTPPLDREPSSRKPPLDEPPLDTTPGVGAAGGGETKNVLIAE